jgi:hypothetical protein
MFTSTIANEERAVLTEKLENLRGGSGFTGKAPGGPSRWSTERSGEWEPVRPEMVVEVRFDHVTGDRFRHGTKLVRWRPDKAPRLTLRQLECAIPCDAGAAAVISPSGVARIGGKHLSAWSWFRGTLGEMPSYGRIVAWIITPALFDRGISDC